jgi:tetratricopeptide (TPR) repeat protein
LAVNPNSWMACNNLAFVYLRTNRPELAAAAASRALQLHPNYFQAEYHLGKSLAMQGRTDEAIKHFIASIKLNSSAALSVEALADAFAEKGALDKAIHYYRAALKTDSRLAHSRQMLPRVLAARERQLATTRPSTLPVTTAVTRPSP